MNYIETVNAFTTNGLPLTDELARLSAKSWADRDSPELRAFSITGKATAAAVSEALRILQCLLSFAEENACSPYAAMELYALITYLRERSA